MGPGRAPFLYLRYKINNMNKKEIKNAINKAAYAFAESLGYEMFDDGMGGSVTFMKPGTKRHDDTIEWHRSYQETCVLNWASDEIKADADAIDAHMKPIIEQYNNQYTPKRVMAQSITYIHGMKILNTTSELVEVLWIDDNEIEFIPINEFKTKYPNHWFTLLIKN